MFRDETGIFHRDKGLRVGLLSDKNHDHCAADRGDRRDLQTQLLCRCAPGLSPIGLGTRDALALCRYPGRREDKRSFDKCLLAGPSLIGPLRDAAPSFKGGGELLHQFGDLDRGDSSLLLAHDHRAEPLRGEAVKGYSGDEQEQL